MEKKACFESSLEIKQSLGGKINLILDTSTAVDEILSLGGF